MENLDLGAVPENPGCYQFFDKERCLYVGKARNLRQRLGYYFSKNIEDFRIAEMVRKAEKIEWVVLPTEADALITEAKLVAEMNPVYNVKLREDHPYPSIAIDSRDGVAKISPWRGPAKKGVETFGPYPGGGVRGIIDAVIGASGIRSCDKGKFRLHQRINRPCLLYEVGRCTAPCVGNGEQHVEAVKVAVDILRGRTRPLIEKNTLEMKSAASELRFEQAARLRDRIEGLEMIRGAQLCDDADGRDLSVVGLHLDGVGGAAAVLTIRSGAIVSTQYYVVESGVVSMESLVQAALRQVGLGARVLVDKALIEDIQAEKTGAEVVVGGGGTGLFDFVKSAKTPRDVRIVAVATENAAEALRRARMMRASTLDARRDELQRLQTALGLKRAPLRIEGVDISHLGGAATVSVVSLLVDGLPVRNRYRKYRLKDHGGDDYAAMREVITRRIADSLDGKAPYMDLLLIDGGANQLAVALDVLRELGVADQIEVASLAKRLEEVYRPDGAAPISLSHSDPALLLLQRVRDETHKASNRFQQQVASKRLRKDYLDGVAGLGEKRKQILLQKLGGWRGLGETRREDLDQIGEIPLPVRDAVWRILENRRGEQ